MTKTKTKAKAKAAPAPKKNLFAVHQYDPTALTLHPLAAMFPEMDDTDFASFQASVAEHGISDPIWVDEMHRVADGRHRLRAAQALGLKQIPTRRLKDRFLTTDAEIRDFVVAQNLHRRHLTESQRAMVAASLVTAKHGGKRPAKGSATPGQGQGQGENSADEPPEKTIAQASEDLKVSTFSTKAGKKVLGSKLKSLIDAVTSGVVKVSLAAEAVEVLGGRDIKDVLQNSYYPDKPKALRKAIEAVARTNALDAAASDFEAAGWDRYAAAFMKEYPGLEEANILWTPKNWKLEPPYDGAEDFPDSLYFSDPAAARAASEEIAAKEAKKAAVASPEEKCGDEFARPVTAAELAMLEEHGYKPERYAGDDHDHYVRKLKKPKGGTVELDFTWVLDQGERWIARYTLKKPYRGSTLGFFETLDEAHAAVEAWLAEELSGAAGQVNGKKAAAASVPPEATLVNSLEEYVHELCRAVDQLRDFPLAEFESVQLSEWQAMFLEEHLRPTATLLGDIEQLFYYRFVQPREVAKAMEDPDDATLRTKISGRTSVDDLREQAKAQEVAAGGLDLREKAQEAPATFGAKQTQG